MSFSFSYWWRFVWTKALGHEIPRCAELLYVWNSERFHNWCHLQGEFFSFSKSQLWSQLLFGEVVSMINVCHFFLYFTVIKIGEVVRQISTMLILLVLYCILFLWRIIYNLSAEDIGIKQHVRVEFCTVFESNHFNLLFLKASWGGDTGGCVCSTIN